MAAWLVTGRKHMILYTFQLLTLPLKHSQMALIAAKDKILFVYYIMTVFASKFHGRDMLHKLHD